VIDNLTVLELIDSHLAGTGLFLVEMKIKPGNKILVFIDGDNGVGIDDCIGLSRKIESGLNRDVEDFELEVSSSGAEAPLRLKRQYIKNIGRRIRVLTQSDIYHNGNLIAVNEDDIDIQIQKEIKDESGKKLKETTVLKVPFSGIKETKLEISFK
jgi:ribosome maturation factor RimP